ncbi:hypothetical protein, partial [Nocardiopsis gilva]|uniref:hypothetical protein n=1 Tax=Nocardiopsis gilva TaxID=280236 RepID=UPI000525ECD6
GAERGNDGATASPWASEVVEASARNAGGHSEGGVDGADEAERRGPRPSGTLLAEALLDPRELTLIDPEVAAPATRVAAHLKLVRDRTAAGDSAEDVL